MSILDYQSLVLRDYETKKAANELSSSLLMPTPALIRDECLEVLKKRFDRKKDQRILVNFFGERSSQSAYADEIYTFPVSKFKPLIKFLQNKTSNPSFKHVDLLAWLIDFEDRPFDYFKSYEAASPSAISTDEHVDNGTPLAHETDMPYTEEENKPATKKPEESSTNDDAKPPKHINALWANKKTSVVAISAALIISASVYFGRMNISSQTPPSGPQSCMYWAGDHYESTPCNETEGKNLVIALDSQKLRNFRKITQQDTITFRSKGFVWYVKINGGIEYYTSDGFHPVDIRLRLKPITDYMIRKYIYNAQASR